MASNVHHGSCDIWPKYTAYCKARSKVIGTDIFHFRNLNFGLESRDLVWSCYYKQQVRGVTICQSGKPGGLLPLNFASLDLRVLLVSYNSMRTP